MSKPIVMKFCVLTHEKQKEISIVSAYKIIRRTKQREKIYII